MEEIDQILLKAESLISQLELGKLASAGPSKKPVTVGKKIAIEKKVDNKPSGVKQTHLATRSSITRNLSASNLSKVGITSSTNETKKKSLPVYLKAPYKTQPLKPMKRVNSASSLSLLRMGSESKEKIKRDDQASLQVEQNRQVQQQQAKKIIEPIEISREPTANKSLKKSHSFIEKNVSNTKKFERGLDERLANFELDFESNKELELDTDLKRLLDLNRKLDQSIDKEMRNRVESQSKKSFFNRLKSNANSSECALALVYNNKLVKSEANYRKGLETLDSLIFDQLIKNPVTGNEKHLKSK